MIRKAIILSAVIRARADDGVLVRSLHNPFFQVAKRLARRLWRERLWTIGDSAPSCSQAP